jgi:hypothetical protein
VQFRLDAREKGILAPTAFIDLGCFGLIERRIGELTSPPIVCQAIVSVEAAGDRPVCDR